MKSKLWVFTLIVFATGIFANIVPTKDDTARKLLEQAQYYKQFRSFHKLAEMLAVLSKQVKSDSLNYTEISEVAKTKRIDGIYVICNDSTLTKVCPFCQLPANQYSRCWPQHNLCENDHEWWILSVHLITTFKPSACP